MATKEDIVKALMGVKDPEIGASIVDLGMVRSTGIQGDTVRVDIALTVPNCPHSSTIRDNVITAVSAFPGVNRVEVQLS
ncbi:MAG: iron-sulfur cluster assembly protein, partial [Candidatus Bathyarchaeia archaeon]